MVTVETLNKIIAEIDAEMVDINANSLDVGSVEHLNAPMAESFEKRSEAMVLKIESSGRKVAPLPRARTSAPQNEGQERQQASDINLPKNESEDIEPAKMFEDILNFLRFLILFLGMRFSYYWIPRKYFAYWVSVFSISFGVVILSHTAHIHYKNENYLRMLEPLAVSGTIISCGLKMLWYLKHWNKILALIYSTRKVCRQNNVGRRADILRAGARRIWTLIRFYNAGIVLCLGFYNVMPLKLFFFDNVWMTLMPMEIVFCDQSTLSGFIAANLVQAFLGILSTIALLMFGLIFILCISCYDFHVDLLAEDFKDLDNMWNGTIDVSIAYRHDFLWNICKKRQDMNEYLNIIKYTYEGKLFYYFCANYFSQIVCLFDVTQSEWVGGYAVALVLFLEMMFYCIMGTQVSISDDKMCYMLTNTEWYNYDIYSQRIIQHLLKECQEPKDITLGVIGQLNVVTGITIVKSIYSYYTVLTELV